MIKPVYLIIILVLGSVFQVLANDSRQNTTVVLDSENDISFSIEAERTFEVCFKSPFYKGGQKDTLNFQISKPLRLVFRVNNPQNSNLPYYYTFLILPGDQVKLKLTQHEVHTVADNPIRENELNFFPKMRAELGNFEGFFTLIPHQRKNADDLMNKIMELYRQRLAFLVSYKEQYTLSPENQELLKSVIKYKTYFEFLDHCKVDGILDNKLLENPKVNDFISTVLDYDDDNIYLLEARFLLLKLMNNDEAAFFEKIKTDYSGQVRDYFLFRVLYQMHGVEKEFEYLFNDYLSIGMSDPLKEIIVEEFGDFVGGDLEIKIPDYNPTQQTLLYNLQSGQFISWDSLLNSGKYLYLDFWATWCGGCRSGLPNTKKLSGMFGSHDFRVIYISLDKNHKAWSKISKKERIPSGDSYLLIETKKSRIIQQYKIAAIPRYMIVNKKGEIINVDAPHPYPVMDKIFDELKEILSGE